MHATPRVTPHAQIWALLDALTDPEIPVVTLRELGILRDVREDDAGQLEVVITPTYSGCPAMGQIEEDIRSTLAAQGLAVKVVTELAPAWTTDWMSENARAKLQAYGIAPPRCSADGSGPHAISNAPAGSALLRFAAPMARPVVPCPQCASPDTTEISAFGSTACKAQYRCLTCMEPFDYFKPY